MGERRGGSQPCRPPTGFSALPDELPARHPHTQEQAASRGGESCGHPPVVSDEDLSAGCSTLQDGSPRTDGAGPAELCSQTPQEQARQGLSGGTAPEEPAAGPQQESL